MKKQQTIIYLHAVPSRTYKLELLHFWTFTTVVQSSPQSWFSCCTNF